MPQITIYVPKELADALDRHREKLNISQTCAQALRQEVEKMERAGALPFLERRLADSSAESGPTDEDVRAIVERLRVERRRSETQDDVRERARSRAAQWLKRAHYDQLRSYGELDLGSDPDQFYATAFTFPDDKEQDAAEDYRDGRVERHLGFDWGTYCRAWHEEVREFWERVKEEI